MSISRWLCLALGISLASLPGRTQEAAPEGRSSPRPLVDLETELAEVMPAWRETWSVPGVAVGVVVGDAVVLLRGFGLADVAGGRPVDEHTVFSIGSISKTFTATLIGALVERGELSWDRPVKELEAAFDLHDERAEREATLRDLLSHRSGIPFAASLYEGQAVEQETLLERLAETPPDYSFREGSTYTNLDVLWAGRIAAARAGGAWEEVLRQEVLDPLGLDDTYTVAAEGQRDPRASLPYDVSGMALPHHEFLQSIAPAGAMYSNLADMLSFARYWLREEGGAVPLSRSMRDEMMRPVVEWDEPSSLDFYQATGMGLGWFGEEYRGQKLAFHGGVTRGFSAQLTLVPERRIGIVVLSNRFGNPIPFIATHYLLDRLLGHEPFDFSGTLWERQQREQGNP